MYSYDRPLLQWYNIEPMWAAFLHFSRVIGIPSSLDFFEWLKISRFWFNFNLDLIYMFTVPREQNFHGWYKINREATISQRISALGCRGGLLLIWFYFRVIWVVIYVICMSSKHCFEVFVISSSLDVNIGVLPLSSIDPALDK